MQRIKMLMKMFNVSGKELANMLYVDSSLVSKWCSGKRKLKPGSSHLNHIVDIFIQIDEHDDYRNLKQIFSETDILDKTLLKVCLRNWLAETDQRDYNSNINYSELMNISKVYNIYVFNQNQGRRDAITFFENYAAVSGAQEVITFNSENPSWFYEDPTFVRQSRINNQMILDKGGKMTMIHPLNTSYDNIAFSLLNWIPLYLSGGNIQGLYMPKYSDDPVFYTYFVIKDKLALMGMSTNKKSDMQTFIFNEKAIINRIEEILQKLVQGCQTLVQYVDDWAVYTDSYNTWPWSVWNIINRKEDVRSINYLYASQLPLFNMSNEILEKALQSCNLSQKERNRLHDEKWDVLIDDSEECRFIIYPKVLKEKLEMDLVPMDILSQQLGREILIPSADYRNLLREVLKKVSDSPNISLGITKPLYMDSSLDYSAFAKSNGGLLFWEAHKYTRMVAVMEMKTTTAVYEYFSCCWEAIPDEQKNKEKVLVYFKGIIDAAEKQKD